MIIIYPARTKKWLKIEPALDNYLTLLILVFRRDDPADAAFLAGLAGFPEHLDWELEAERILNAGTRGHSPPITPPLSACATGPWGTC